MECFFEDFGYALRTDPNATVSLLPRNQATAWLTKYLRSYMGSGKVTIEGVNYQIGRWLRDVNFSGVSFVDTPANPESIVFQDIIDNSQVFASFSEKSDTVSENSVLLDSIPDNKDIIMASDKKVETAKADETVVETKTAEVIAPVQDPVLIEKVKTLEETIANLTKALEASTAKVSEAEAKIKEYNEATAKNAKVQKGKDRFAKMKEAGAASFVSEKEDEAVSALAEMDDASFTILEKTATALAKNAVAMSNMPKLTEHTFSSQPKLTEQTFTNLPKLTEASAKEQLDSAVAEKEANLAAVAAAGKDVAAGKAALDTFMAAAFDTNPKKNKKVTKSA